MDKQILPERSNPTEKVVLRLIAASAAGLTIKEMNHLIGRRARILRVVMIEALERLVREEILESEMRGKETVYYLPWQTPLPFRRVIPAGEFFPLPNRRCTWLSALGVAA